MFKVKEDFDVTEANKASWELEKNYLIQPADYLSIEVLTNDGERAVDPNYVLSKDIGSVQDVVRPKFKYLVENDGMVKVPQIGRVNLGGLSLRAAETLLEEKFAVYYEIPYVKINYLNKRVSILGAVGGKVLPLENENTTLIEILAQAEGINNDAKAHNIRLIRSDEVFVIDLSTIEGMRKTNMIIAPGDIIYVEPVRRPLSESAREFGPVIGIFTSVLTLVVVLLNSN